MQIYVGNLAFTATIDDVRQLFESYGDVARVNLPEDRETGRPRGFGFVEMPNDTEARAAIAGLNGKDLGGRSLMVNEARPREERGGTTSWASVVSAMRAPRHLRGAFAQPPRRPPAPLPGYLCEVCQDAPAVQWQPVPEGGETRCVYHVSVRERCG